MPPEKWNILFSAITVFLTLVGGIYQWRHSRFRSKLKDDLEILASYEAYGKDTEGYKALRKSIDINIEKAYLSSENGFSKERIPDLIVGLVLLVGSVYLVVWDQTSTESTWWKIPLAILSAFISIGGFLNAFSSETVND